MSLTNAQRAAKREQMFPTLRAIERDARKPTRNERLAFARYGLSAAARKIAVYAARHSVGAAACYAAIRRSL